MRAPKVRTEVRREQIALAAIGLVARRGWHGFSVDALAREVGVVPSAIYRHYRSKGAVLDALLGLISRRLKENVAAVRREAPDPAGRLLLLLERHMRMVRENPGIPRVIFSEEVMAGEGVRRARLYRLIQCYLSQVADMIRAGQVARQLRRDAGAGTLAVMFLGLIQPAAILHLASRGRFDAAGFQRKAWRLYEQMITVGAGVRRAPRGSDAARRKQR